MAENIKILCLLILGFFIGRLLGWIIENKIIKKIDAHKEVNDWLNKNWIHIINKK